MVLSPIVIPAKAGTQPEQANASPCDTISLGLDPGLRRGDEEFEA
jgi:hypothetical protein